MIKERNFVFSEDDTNINLEVIVPEVIDPDYSMYTWPCAPVLAQFIWSNRHNIPGKTTLEIGAGTALPSIVLGKCGAIVNISDRPDLTSYSNKTRHSFSLNGLSPPPVHTISWGMFDSSLFGLPNLDIVIASDCFYNTKDFEDILVTVAYLFDKNPDCEFWCTYQERSSSRSIQFLLEKWNIQCRSIPLTSFLGDGPSVAQSDLPGDHTIHMFVMRKMDK